MKESLVLFLKKMNQPLFEIDLDTCFPIIMRLIGCVAGITMFILLAMTNMQIAVVGSLCILLTLQTIYIVRLRDDLSWERYRIKEWHQRSARIWRRACKRDWQFASLIRKHYPHRDDRGFAGLMAQLSYGNAFPDTDDKDPFFFFDAETCDMEEDLMYTSYN